MYNSIFTRSLRFCPFVAVNFCELSACKHVRVKQLWVWTLMNVSTKHRERRAVVILSTVIVNLFYSPGVGFAKLCYIAWWEKGKNSKMVNSSLLFVSLYTKVISTTCIRHFNRFFIVMCCRNKINASEANFIHSMIDQYSLRN